MDGEVGSSVKFDDVTVCRKRQLYLREIIPKLSSSRHEPPHGSTTVAKLYRLALAQDYSPRLKAVND